MAEEGVPLNNPYHTFFIWKTQCTCKIHQGNMTLSVFWGAHSVQNTFQVDESHSESARHAVSRHQHRHVDRLRAEEHCQAR